MDILGAAVVFGVDPLSFGLGDRIEQKVIVEALNRAIRFRHELDHQLARMIASEVSKLFKR